MKLLSINASILSLLLSTLPEYGAAFVQPQGQFKVMVSTDITRGSTTLHMMNDKKTNTKDFSSSKKNILSASTISDDSFSSFEDDESPLLSWMPEQSTDMKKFAAIVSAALLITSNTVGASMMVLPGLAQGPGMITSSCIFFAVYLVNLLSGLLIAEVAINQYESSKGSSCEVPSSFKEFADANLQSNLAGNMISAISLFINTCVLSYDLVTAGRLTNQAITSEFSKNIAGNDIVNSLQSFDSAGISIAAGFFVLLVSTQSGAALSSIASICCMTLFACFAGLVLPGLAMIHDPLATFAAKGTSEFGGEIFMHDISNLVPVLLTAMVYQNIVPTIVKRLNYDRELTTKAIIGGSAIPMIMYILFCFTVLGGGALPGAGSGNMFLTGITTASVFGSATACVISISEEIGVFFDSMKNEKECELIEVPSEENVNVDETASFPSVALSIAAPLVAGIFFAEGDGFVQALSVAGSYGSPLLYGVVPVVLAFSQRNAIFDEIEKMDVGIVENTKVTLSKIFNDESDREKQIIPGGVVPPMALFTGATYLISSHLIQDVSSVFSS